MDNENRYYIAIDLKSFYASVECSERGLDPLTTNLVVADVSRTEKTICLAVSPSLKAYGIPGRARLFEVIQRLREVNASRLQKTAGRKFTGKSFDSLELADNPELEIDYIAATPQMKKYMQYSTRIFNIYMKYVSPEDIHVYSIDEIFADVTHYLGTYSMSAEELAKTMILDVLEQTGITATAGVGTNLYLAKVAMDIVAKHIPADENGVRIASLDEKSYREKLWNHTPLTDFWRVGRGYSAKLMAHGLYTMGDIARCSIGSSNDFYNEELLYDLFGVNAELLIDHAWGYEPATMAEIKAYKPENNSLSQGQVLTSPYTFEKARLVTMEMVDQLVLDMVEKGLVCDLFTLTVSYDSESMSDPAIRKKYKGQLTTDYYGRLAPKPAHGTATLDSPSSSTKEITDKLMLLYDRIVNPDLMVRRISLDAGHVISEEEYKEQASEAYEQLDLFTDYSKEQERRENKQQEIEREKRMQQAVLSIKKKYGKNAILRGMNLEDGATAMARNNQVGGHKA